MTTTPRKVILFDRAEAIKDSRRCRDLLRGLPDELLDLAMDNFSRYNHGIAVHQTDLQPGMLSTLLDLCIEDEARARKTWQAGVKVFDFTLPDGTPIELTTRAKECKKYKVMERIPKPKTITICGEPDPEQYIVMEVVN